MLIAAQAASAIGLARRRSEQSNRDRLASIGRMLAGLLHDLKTPMTIISGYAQLMAACDEAAQRDTYVEQIQRQFDLMAGMTREVLAFARGDTDLVVRKVYVNRFAEELTTQLGAATAGRGIDFEVEAALRRHRVLRRAEAAARVPQPHAQRDRGDARGRQAAGRGRPRRRRPGLGRAATPARASRPSCSGRLFELFATGKKGGTGLGLAIVKKIVDDHRGTIACETGPHGTTFMIRLAASGAAPIRD